MAGSDSLENKQISSTYKDLLQVPNANSGVDGTVRTVMDGEGTESALQVSTAGVKSTGTLESTGNLTVGGSLTLGSTEVTSSATELNLLDGLTAVDTDLSSVSSSDDTLASAKSIKTYVDSQVQSKDDLSELSGTLDDITAGTTNKHFTATDETKLAGIETGAEVNVNADWDATTGDAQILNKPSTFSPSSHTHAISEVTNLQSSLDAKIANVSEDTTPQLGGDLDVGSNEINTSTTNGNIEIAPNGTGATVFKGNTNAGKITLNCENNNHGVSLASPAHDDYSGSWTLTLPTSAGSNGQVLTTNGSGVASWAAGSSVSDLNDLADVNAGSPSDGQVLKWNDSASEWQAMADNNSGTGGGGTPAGSTGQIQFNSGGSFGADSNLVWDESNNRLYVDSNSAAVRIRRADATRYRSDFAVNSSGLSINSYDDTGSAYMPMTLDGSTFKFRNGGSGNALTIDSSGNCGIGATPSSSAKLHVYDSVAGTHKTLVENANSSGIVFTSHKGSGGYGCNVGYASTGWTTIPLLTDRGFVSAQSGTDGLVLNTEGSDPIIFGTNNTERMRIDSDGRVHVRKYAQFMQNDGTSVAGQIGNANAINGNNQADLALHSTRYVEFSVGGNSTPKMVLDSGGNLALGHAIPSDLLHLSGSSPVIRGHDTDGGSAKINFGAGNITLDADFAAGESSSLINFKVDGTERMRIKADGQTHFNSGATNTVALFESEDEGAGINLTDTTGSSIIQTTGTDLRIGVDEANAVANSTMSFRVDGSTKMRIDSSGDVGIGTIPSSIVHASKSAGVNFQANSRAFFGSLYSNHFAVLGCAVKADDGTTTQMVSTETSSGNGRPSAIQLGAGNIDFHTAASSTAGAAFDSLRMRIDSSGASYFYGQLNVAGGSGTTTNRLNFSYNASNGVAEIAPDSNSGHTELKFSTCLSGTKSEAMRVDNTGRVTVKKSSNAEVTPLTDGATITPDFDDANNFSVTLGGNRTLANPSNCTAGQSGIITITQPASSTHTLVYGSYWKFSGGTAPNLTTTAGAVDVLAYYVESATRITATLITDTK